MVPFEGTVSVIITAYNIAGYVGEAIQSVLEQSHQPEEILVVDDGSTDGTRQAIEKFGDRVTYLYEENSGTSTARNTGIQYSNGDLIAFLDGDDLWLKDKLRKQVEALQDRPDLDLLFTQAENFRSPPAEEEQRVEAPMNGCIPSTLLIKRSAFFKVGFFLVDQNIAEFVPWYAQARECKLAEHIVPEVLVKRRIHDTNKSILNRQYKNQELLRMFREKIHRTRDAGTI